MLLQCFVPGALSQMSSADQSGHSAAGSVSTAASNPSQPLCPPSSAGTACPGVHPGSSLETFQHPGACSSVQEELHNTWCLYPQPARSFVLFLPAFVNSSDRCVQPLNTTPYFSLPSLLSWHNAVSSSSFNPNELPSAYDYRVPLPVVCTVSSLTLSFTSCTAISLA